MLPQQPGPRAISTASGSATAWWRLSASSTQPAPPSPERGAAFIIWCSRSEPPQDLGSGACAQSASCASVLGGSKAEEARGLERFTKSGPDKENGAAVGKQALRQRYFSSSMLLYSISMAY